MQKELSYYNGLLAGFISNTIAVEQVTELLGFIEEEPAAFGGLLENPAISSLLEQQAYDPTISIPEEASARMKERLMAAVNESRKNGPKQIAGIISIWKLVAAAAAVILFISFGAYFIFRAKETREVAKASAPKNDIAAPAGTKATITLSNGQTVSVDSLNSGTLATQGKVKILKNANGIVYSSQGSPLSGEAGVSLNTLINPRGSSIITLTLSDGSQVWLNAGSSLKYPAAFTGGERKVEIIGEAYFEVAHNPKLPFKVIKDNAEVEVLGTHFNVNAYDDEAAIKITLLEGSVKVAVQQAQGGTSAIIKPGEQAQIENHGNLVIPKIVVQSVDLDEVLAWKNDLFHFESADVQTILRQFARWYDVEVIYEGTPNNKKFFGIVSRKSSLTEVLQLLKANNIKFRIEGKKLIVTSS